MPVTSPSSQPPVGSRILVIGPDISRGEGIGALLETRGYHCWIGVDCAASAASLPAIHPAAAVVELPSQPARSEVTGCVRLLRTARSLDPAVPLIVIAQAGHGEESQTLLRLGAADVIPHPGGDEELLRRLDAALRGRANLKDAARPRAAPDQPELRFEAPPAVSAAAEAFPPDTELLIGRSEAIRHVWEQIRLVAHRDTSVLITGETGAGKERVARAIHHYGSRSDRPLVSVNCGGIPANLLEDEFFGHVKGAFTDAHQERLGRFEQAHRGAIFLDEIGDLPLELQPKLLRVLQEREIHRVGGSETIRVDVRVIAATNADLWNRVSVGGFREDLFYRINVFPIHLPPLRQRREDVPLFVEHFLEKFCRRDGLEPKRVEPSAEAALMARSWPGNIRELENAVEIAVIRSEGRRIVTLDDFPAPRKPGQPSSIAALDEGAGFKEIVAQFERDLISRVLLRTGGNKTQAADQLHIKRTTLIEKVKKLQIEASSDSD